MLLKLEHPDAGEVRAGARLPVDPRLPPPLEDDREDEERDADGESEAEAGHAPRIGASRRSRAAPFRDYDPPMVRARRLLSAIALAAFLPGSSWADATVLSESGDLAARVREIASRMPGSESEGFVKPSADELARFRELVSKAASGDVTGAAAHAEAAGLPYRVVRFTDTGAGSREVLLLEERMPLAKGWGTFVLDPAPLRDLVVEAPHARYDVETENQAFALFRRLRARAFLLAGTHRCANAERTPCDGTTDVCGTSYYRVSDPAHFTAGPFQEAHEALVSLWPSSVSFSVHGHSSSDCEDVFLSSGVGADPGPLVPALRERLLAEGGLTVGAAGIPGSSCTLTGGTNVQGRFSNGSAAPCTKAAAAASGRFLHAEQSRAVRTDAALTEKLARALEAVLPALGPATRLVLPSSARSPGAGGTFFTTELTLSNPGPLAAEAEVRFASHDGDGTSGPVRSAVLAAGSSRRWADVLGTLFSIDEGWGALHVTSASGGIVASGQTTTPAAGGGTYGQSVPALGPGEWVGHGAPRSVPGIREDAAFRTNLVVANPGTTEVVVALELLAEDGARLGTGTATLPPLGMTQLSRVVRVLGAAGDVAGARLVLEPVTPGGSVAAYAVLIDSATGDPRTLLPR